MLKGSSEVVALGADTVGLATAQRGLFFQKGANRNDSSQIRAVNAEGNHLSQGCHGQNCCQYRRTTYPSYYFQYNIVVSNRQTFHRADVIREIRGLASARVRARR
jgi:hypothetical protein